ncbi:MAG: Fic family protein [archaeon]|nr:Fic family protein [archaeon]
MANLPDYPDGLLAVEKIRTIHIEASRSLAKLDGALSFIPNVEVITGAIPLMESVYSCRIENVCPSLSDVFRSYYADSAADKDVSKVIGYRNAMDMFDGKDTSIPLLEEMCSSLNCDRFTIRSTEKDTVFLIDQNGNIVSRPPDGNEVPKLLEGLLTYIEGDSEDPLIKTVVVHGMFEMIHPFGDGNGRTGRIFIDALLQKYGLLRRPVLHLSRFIWENRRGYYRYLRLLERDGDWESFVYYLLKGIRNSADHIFELINRIRESLQSNCELSSEKWCSKELICLLYSQVCIRPKHLVDAGIASRNTATHYLQKLEEMGILKGEQAGKGKIYINSELLESLTE